MHGNRIRQIDILIFDADDTLWENNIFYIQTTDAVFDLMQYAGYSREHVESEFYKIEHRMVQKFGYGSEVFEKILHNFIQHCPELSRNQKYSRQFEKIITEFKSHWLRKPALFPGVENTLKRLDGKFRNFILTKGNYNEQLGKIRRSGLSDYFQNFFIEPEKNTATLKRILGENNWEPQRVCMIGNSPKSDINPALTLGLHAIFIPYAHTWKLDGGEVIANHPNLRVIECFTDLPAILFA